MSDFRRLSDTVWASPQITTADVEVAARQGFTLIVNNRPDGESDDQPAGAEIAAAASALGLGYVAIPINQTGYSDTQIAAMAGLLGQVDGKVLAYCRSGTRSTYLWSLAQARGGKNPAEIAAAAAGAGYDVTGLGERMAALSGKAHG